MTTRPLQIIDLWMAQIPNAQAWPGAGFYALPEAVQHEILAYQKVDDQLRVYTGKRLLTMIFKDWGDPASLLNHCRKDAMGRPFLPEFPDFNISHSGEWVVAASIPEGRVGVDIEQMRSIDIDLFQRQFTEMERTQMKASASPFAAFFSAWTAKEALIKADGRGMRLPLHHLHCAQGKATIEGENTEYWNFPLDAPDGYKGHVCANRPFQIVITFASIHG